MSRNKVPELFVFPINPEDAKKFEKAYNDFLAIVDQFRDDPNFDMLPFVMSNSEQYMKCIKKYFSEDEFQLHKKQHEINALKDITQEMLASSAFDKTKKKEILTHYRLKDKILAKEILELQEKIEKAKNETDLKKDL